MNFAALGLSAAALPGAIPTLRVPVGSGEILATCRLAWEQRARLCALWLCDDRDLERGFTLKLLLEDADGLALLEHTLPDAGAQYPDIAAIFPVANRMQRAAFDLMGVQSEADDQRPWLWLAGWPIDRFPLQRDFVASPAWEPGEEQYAFVRVEGGGVHEIAVGPVHAGTIEPGHFRFQVVGEKVLRLEERLGYTHKGIEKRFESMSASHAHRLAARICGDSTVAYGWAYAQALESVCGVAVPPRAAWLRALALERERIGNHLGDLGALGNDGGFAFGLAQFSRLREDVLRLNARAFGHRLIMDYVVPGGVAAPLDSKHALAIRDQCAMLMRELCVLRDIYDDHDGLQDRFRNCGRVTPQLARQLGLVGLAGRASGQAQDLRCDHPGPPYDTLGPRIASNTDGDIVARVAVRFDELAESLRITGAIVDALPAGDHVVALPAPPAFRQALGYIEGWRGPVLIALETGPVGSIRRCHPQDPSWSNWPVLEHAIIGNIVPDFPLINKSFNLAYSGHDL